jgi:hypothetical protein
MDVKVEEWAGFAPGLVHDKVVESVMLVMISIEINKSLPTCGIMRSS